MTSLFKRLNTYRRLGVFNILSVVYYRWQVKSGYFEKVMPVSSWVFAEAHELMPAATSLPVAKAPYKVSFFSSAVFEQTSPPAWFLNPYNNLSLEPSKHHWSKIPDFGLSIGDVKTVWELSRFDWLIKACWQTRNTQESPVNINEWLRSWCECNPINQGINWKCAQEVSIRAINMVIANYILDANEQFKRSDTQHFLFVHLQRILPTVRYAKAQDNNHGTSEAAALFTIGHLLSTSNNKTIAAEAKKAGGIGRRLLEDRCAKLINENGDFSQYSVNYHRMMLDTLSFAEIMRVQLGAARFSENFLAKARKATCWLLNVTDPRSGDAPNIGTNDGSLLFNCDDIDFRDFRPSCQLACSVFFKEVVFDEHTHSLSRIFASSITQLQNEAKQTPKNQNTPLLTAQSTFGSSVHSSFKRIGNKTTFGILKVPNNRFRPSQADALHLDLWHQGKNIIRDAGTYSYNPPPEFTDDLGDTTFHSTVQADDRSQMPKLSRFLYAGWLAPNEVALDPGRNSSRGSDSVLAIAGGYTDSLGVTHIRKVSFKANAFQINDQVEGVTSGAVLRFRLYPGNWIYNDNSVSLDDVTLEVTGQTIVSSYLTESVESRYYLRIDPVPVFEVELSGDGVINTTLRLTNLS